MKISKIFFLIFTAVSLIGPSTDSLQAYPFVQESFLEYDFGQKQWLYYYDDFLHETFNDSRNIPSYLISNPSGVLHRSILFSIPYYIDLPPPMLIL